MMGVSGDRRRVGSAHRAHFRAEPFPDSLDRRDRWFDQQRRAVAADVEPQKIEPSSQVHDSGLVLVEDQTPGCQPFGQACFDLFGLPLGVAERDQIVSVPDHHRGARLGVAGLPAGGDVADSRGVFQPVQRDVKE
jgi:hypothetical protein